MILQPISGAWVTNLKCVGTLVGRALKPQPPENAAKSFLPNFEKFLRKKFFLLQKLKILLVPPKSYPNAAKLFLRDL